MDAVKFFKTVNMLCKNQSCEECPVYKNDMCCIPNPSICARAWHL
jgi:hypothetical protein|nr:MAG TPA: 14-3-3 protein gamma [Caudoviricetes sp.]